MLTVINFSHPFSSSQRTTLEGLVGQSVEIQTIPVQIDFGRDLIDQAVAVVDLANVDWQAGGSYLVRPPALSEVVAVLLAEIHGRAGHFPRVVTFRRASDGSFEVSGVVALQTVRDTARTRR